MIRFILLVILAAGFVACATQNDPPLPEITKSDPVWTLQPDHLDYGMLPR